MIPEFITYLSSLKGYSGNTIKAYQADCQEFARYIKQHTDKARWQAITRKEVDGYIIMLTKQGQSTATTNRKLSSISALYKYMKREGYDVENPTKYESRRKQADRIPSTISPEAIKMAYDHADGTTKIIIGLLATTGIRIDEALKLTWDDVDLTTGVLSIIGKGGVARQVITSREVVELLRTRLAGSELHCRIFAWSQRTARYYIFQALKPWSTAKQLSPHAIRHTYATELAKSGASAITIAKILGHKHISTTQKYIDMAQVPILSANIC